MAGMYSTLARATLCAGLAAGLAFPQPGVAGPLVLDLTNVGSPAVDCGSQCGVVSGATFGWSFRLSDAIVINGLGVWDAGADGILTNNVPIGVGLWTATGTLVASAQVTNASSKQASAAVAAGQWLFEDVAATLLAPGSYVLGSVLFDAFPLVAVTPTTTIIPEVFVTGSVIGPTEGGLQFPDTGFSIFVFGPTMRLATAVPEPGALALVAIGLLGFGVVRRARTRC